MTTRWARVARGFAAAVVSLFVAAVSHIVPGGNVPGALALLACLILSTLVCIALSGKKLSLVRLSSAVIASQFLFHGIFSLSTASPASLMHSGHVHDQLVTIGTAGMTHLDGGMWMGHSVAAVLTIVALRYGEIAFWGLFSVAQLWVSALFAAMAAPLPVEVPALCAPRELTVLPQKLILPLSAMRHRGPPARQFATS